MNARAAPALVVRLIEEASPTPKGGQERRRSRGCAAGFPVPNGSY